MSIEQNKAITRRVLDAFESGDTATLEDLVAEEFVQHGPNVPPTRADLFRFHAAFHTAFPDGKFIVEDMIGEGEKVLIRWTMRGTQTGPWFGVAPTGRTVNFVGMDLWRYSEGRLAESWFVGDNLTLMKQLGILKGF